MATPSIMIRPATLDDAEAIGSIQIETWKSAYRGLVADEFLDGMSKDERKNRWSEILLRAGCATFVSEVDGKHIIGFANGGPGRDERADFRGELNGLYVLPDWHRQRIGSRLVGSIAHWLLKSGLDTMLVWTLADNPFRPFYERLGGKLIAEKDIEIGEQKLREVAYGWDTLSVLIERTT